MLINKSVDIIINKIVYKYTINYTFFFLLLDNAIVFNDADEETMSLLSTTTYKVIVKNFKKLDETDLGS